MIWSRFGVGLWCVALATPASAFTLDPIVHLTDGRNVLHLEAGGATVAVAWSGVASPQEIRAVTSVDRGATFGPVEVVQTVQPTLGAFRTLYAVHDAAMALSADGVTRTVLSGLVMEDSRVPPFGVDYYGAPVPVPFWGLATWTSDAGGPFAPAAFVDQMTLRCDAGGSRCRALEEISFALDDDASSGWAAYTAYAPPRGFGTGRELLISRVERGVFAGAPLNTAGALTVVEAYSGVDVRTDSTGDLLVLSQESQAAATSDGGATWTNHTLPFTLSGDVDVARDAGTVLWATTYAEFPDPNEIRLRTSADGGVTFAAPVLVARTQAGRYVSADYVRMAVSRDGTTVAVTYDEIQPGGSNVVLAVSEDSGATFSRVGVAGAGSFAAHDVAIAPDGDTIYVITQDGLYGVDGTNFTRAVR